MVTIEKQFQFSNLLSRTIWIRLYSIRSFIIEGDNEKNIVYSMKQVIFIEYITCFILVSVF